VTTDTTAREPDLERSFIAFTRMMFGYPDRWARAGWGPFVHERLAVSPHGHEQYETRQHEDYRMLIDDDADAIAREPATIACVELHIREGVFRGGMPTPTRVGHATLPAEGLQRVVMDLLLQPILDMLGRHDGRQMTDAQVTTVYRHYRAAWSASRVPWVVIVPLINSTGSLPRRETIGRFNVEPLLPQEKASLQNILTSSGTGEVPDVSWLGLRHARYKLIARFETDLTASHEVVDNEREAIVSEVRDVILALRLLGAGTIAAPVIDQRSFVDTPQLSHIVTSAIEYAPRDWPPRPIYDMGAPDMQAVAILTEAIRRLNRQPGRGGLEVALRRFAQSYSRDVFGEDIIIDLTIALEGSILFGLKDELKYRLALRGAALLATEPSSDAIDVVFLTEVKALLQLVYDTRSLLVHEGAYLQELTNDKGYMRTFRKALPNAQPTALPALCEDIVRRILWAYISRLTADSAIGHIKNINADVESALIAGLTARAPQSVQSGATTTDEDTPR